MTRTPLGDRPRRAAAATGLLVLCLSPVAACSDPTLFTGCGTQDVAASVSGVVVATGVEAALYFTVADPIADTLLAPPGPMGDSASAAAALVAAAGPMAFPGGCAAVTASANAVTFALHDCSGPVGLDHATGTVTAILLFEPGEADAGTGGEFKIELTGDNVQANGAALILNTSALLTVALDGGRWVGATSMTNGTGPGGGSVNHNGSFAMSWSRGANCAAVNADLANISVEAFGSADEVLTDYVVCTGSCPTAGTATSSFEAGTIQLTYAGAPYVICTASTGSSDAIPLSCR